MRRRAFIALPLAVVAAGRARAAEVAVRTTGLHHRHGKLAVSVGVPDIIQPADAQRLKSGFATRVLVRVALFREGIRQPLAQAYRLADIVYDLWDEKFTVRRTDARGVGPGDVVGAPAELLLALGEVGAKHLGRAIRGTADLAVVLDRQRAQPPHHELQRVPRRPHRQDRGQQDRAQDLPFEAPGQLHEADSTKLWETNWMRRSLSSMCGLTKMLTKDPKKLSPGASRP